MAKIDEDRFPEWVPFLRVVQEHSPNAGTWCEAWTVRDIVAHQAGNAEELARVLGGHLTGEPVATRSFEEREPPWGVPMILDRDSRLRGSVHARAASQVQPAVQG
jgi:hypothetical protein